MSRKACCGMCQYFYAGKCTIKEEKPVDCLDVRCSDFKGFFGDDD